jgi:hypothetical protein
VTVTDESGNQTEVPVTDDVAVTTRAGRYAASFEYEGKRVEVFPMPADSPKMPTDSASG